MFKISQIKLFRVQQYLLHSLLLIFVLFINEVVVADYEEEVLLELYGDEETVSIATGTSQSISRAPAVASVITAEEIKNIGATDIDDVLETVPGLHVSRTSTNNPNYIFRGMYTSLNPQVLLLINGIPVKSLFTGDRHQVWGGMPVEAISRIEVIRGPGSAVHGADAVAGVINVVTKTSKEIDGFEFGSRIGEFDSKDAWALYGGKFGNFDVAFMSEWGATDGHDEKIYADVASVFGTSRTPASLNTQTDNIDLRLDVSTGKWQFRAGYQNRKNVGLGIGVANALTPSEYKSDRYNLDLTYHNKNLGNWDILAQTSFYNTSQEAEDGLEILPPGTFGLPDGFISTPETWERHLRHNITAAFSGFDNHDIRAGVGYNNSDVYRVKEEKNLGNGVVPGVLTDVTDTPFVFLQEKHRSNSFAFLQDIWRISNDWELTAGLRYDDYNDFGDTWNPRAALVWSARHNLTAKLLYGKAFRAPSFAEFRNDNNPVAIGNSDLDPEETETIELAFDYRPFDNLKLGLNVYKYEWDDIIELIPDPPLGMTSTFQNNGEQEGYGFEFEFDWKATRTFSLVGNFAHIDAENKDTNEDAGNAPENQLYLHADWKFMPGWSISPQINIVMDRERVHGDTRSSIDDYEMVDVTLRRQFSRFGQWEFALSGRNIFNKRAFEPTQPVVPGDQPIARRSIWGEFRFNY